MKIALTQGMFTSVDSHNSDLNKFKWSVVRVGSVENTRFYAVRKNNVRLHRVVMERYLGRPLYNYEIVDHKNGNGLDNRVKNLRIVNAKQNSQNVRTRGGIKSSIYKGVSFSKACGRWQAYIQTGGKRRHLGLFDHEKDAAVAYDMAADELFGEYACLNFPKIHPRKASSKRFLKVGLL